jgi:hypothetical protein
MIKPVYFLFLIFLSAVSTVAYSQASSIPPSYLQVLRSKGLDKKYIISNSMVPSFLLADFNGDRQEDAAIFVTNIAGKKKGILVIHGISKEVNIFGAGKNFGNGSDDFSWVAKWDLNINSKNNKGIPAIEIMDANDIGGLIKWNGKKYTWIQQGD